MARRKASGLVLLLVGVAVVGLVCWIVSWALGGSTQKPADVPSSLPSASSVYEIGLTKLEEARRAAAAWWNG